MSETLVMEPTEEMTATQVMPAEGQVAVQTAEQYVELPIADAPEPEQEPSVPETPAEEPAAKVPDAGTDENSNSIDVEIENMVWEVEDADPAEDDDLHRIVEEEMAEEEPVYDDYQDQVPLEPGRELLNAAGYVPPRTFFPVKMASSVESSSDFPKRRGRDRKYIPLAGRISRQMYSVLST